MRSMHAGERCSELRGSAICCLAEPRSLDETRRAHCCAQTLTVSESEVPVKLRRERVTPGAALLLTLLPQLSLRDGSCTSPAEAAAAVSATAVAKAAAARKPEAEEA